MISTSSDITCLYYQCVQFGKLRDANCFVSCDCISNYIVRLQEYLHEAVQVQPGHQGMLGDSVAWGGCTIIYLLGQQLHFELFDFSHQVLNVAEVEVASITSTHRSSHFLQVWKFSSLCSFISPIHPTPHKKGTLARTHSDKISLISHLSTFTLMRRVSKAYWKPWRKLEGWTIMFFQCWKHAARWRTSKLAPSSKVGRHCIESSLRIRSPPSKHCLRKVPEHTRPSTPILYMFLEIFLLPLFWMSVQYKYTILTFARGLNGIE